MLDRVHCVSFVSTHNMVNYSREVIIIFYDGRKDLHFKKSAPLDLGETKKKCDSCLDTKSFRTEMTLCRSQDKILYSFCFSNIRIAPMSTNLPQHLSVTSLVNNLVVNNCVVNNCLVNNCERFYW